MRKLLLFFLIVFTGASAQTYHDTQGRLEISDNGQAVYTLPIALPPSIQQVGPTVNITYTSGVLGGIAGQGFTINSISTISRISTRKDIEGYIDGVDFDDNDKLALNGIRLLLKSGTYFQDGSAYVTEIQSNSKIELFGSGNLMYFIVTAPDGSRTWYGNYSGANASDHNAFYITRFEDTNGNYIKYTYDNLYGKSLCVTKIEFSGNATLQAQNSIDFIYEQAVRTENAYIKGLKHEKVALLKEVVVKNNGLQFKKYGFSHSYDLQLGYQFLGQIREYNSTGQSANPVVFYYGTTIESNPWNEIAKTYNNNFSLSEVVCTGDFDGDGGLDFVTGDHNIYTKTFIGDSGNTPISAASLSVLGTWAGTSTKNNKLNQGNCLINRSAVDMNSMTFKTYDLINNVLTVNNSKTISIPNYGNCVSFCPNYTCPSTQFLKSTRATEHLLGDYNGDGISEMLLFMHDETRTYNYTPGPNPIPEGKSGEAARTEDPVNCSSVHTVSDFVAGLRLLDLKPESSTTLGSAGYVSFPTIGLSIWNGKRFVADFNGDGKSDVLVVKPEKTYNVITFKQLTAAPWVEIEVIGSGTLPAYSNTKQVLIGDYNGDGKSDLNIPDTEGGEDDDLWHIYYGNPNPSFGNFFVEENHTIVEYRPNTTQEGSVLVTQYHASNYYAIDINHDGKSDMVRIWRKKYDDAWDNDTQWRITAFTNNIGNSQSATTFTPDYAPVNFHDNESPNLVVPIVSSYLYNGLNRDVLLYRKHTNKLTYINFTRDFSKDILIKSVTSAGGNIVDEITYQELLPITPGPSGLGAMNEFYSSADGLNYPHVELKRLPGIRLVQKLKNTANGVEKYQDFKYHGFTVNMNGLGPIGFRKIARSAWYQTPSVKRIWNVLEYDTGNWRGALQRSYSQMVNTGSAFSFVSSGDPLNILNSTVSTYVSYTDNGVYTIFLNTQNSTDFLTGVTNEKIYTYSTPFILQTSLVSKNYLGTLQGTTTTVTDYYNNSSGIGSDYYIGRLKSSILTTTAYSNTHTTEEKYTYNGNRLTKKETRSSNTASLNPADDNVFVVEDYEYFPNGNVKKKILSAPGATVSVAPRVMEFTYDASERYVKTIKDIDGLVTTHNLYHDRFGLPRSITNAFGQTSQILYDAWGKKIQEIDYKGNDTFYDYTKTGTNYITTQTSDSGSQSSITTDVLGRVIKKGSLLVNNQWSYVEIQYDYLGRKWKESEPSFTTPSQYTTFFYDDYSRTSQVSEPTGKVSNIAYSGLIVTTNDGTKTSIVTKNSNGHVVSTSDPGGTVTYAYYASGLVKETNYGTASTKFKYDGRGRKMQMEDPSAGINSYTYNIFGDLLSETTPKGTTEYSLNPTGKPAAKHTTGGGRNYWVYYDYDPVNKKLITADGYDLITYDEIILEYFYDNEQRLEMTIESDPATGTYFQKDFTYDNFNRIQTERFISQVETGNTDKTITHAYKNGHNWRMLDGTTVLWSLDNVTARNQPYTIHYNGPIGEETRTYDSYGFPDVTKFKNLTGSYATSGFFMIFDVLFNAPRGNLTNRVSTTLGPIESYQYDSLDRLTHFSNGSGVTETQAYNDNGTINNYSQVGNYQYDDTNKPFQLSKVSLATSSVPHYTDRPLQQVSYDALKNPVTIYEEGKERISLRYNPIGERAVMYSGDLNTDPMLRKFRKYYSAEGSFEAKFNTQTNVTEIVTFIGGDAYTAPLIYKQTGATGAYYYLHRDYLGSIMGISAATGQLVEKRHFDAWGNIVRLQDGTNNNLSGFVVLDRGYTGHEHLTGVGLINMNGRLYDPKIHRMLAPDQNIQEPSNTQSFNRYGYCFNNPLRYTDPSGETVGGFFTAVGIGVAIAVLTYTVTTYATAEPFSSGGLLKSAAFGAFTSAVTFGIGSVATSISSFALRTSFQAIAHGTFQGIMVGIQGGDPFVGFACGALSSLAASLWQGGATFHGDGIPPTITPGLGGYYGNSSAGLLLFGTATGGATAVLAKGNFWEGASIGFMTAFANHLQHGSTYAKDLDALAKSEFGPNYKSDLGIKDLLWGSSLPSSGLSVDGNNYLYDSNTQFIMNNTSGNTLGGLTIKGTVYISDYYKSQPKIYSIGMMGHEFVHAYHMKTFGASYRRAYSENAAYNFSVDYFTKNGGDASYIKAFSAELKVWNVSSAQYNYKSIPGFK